jgi:hypothetical protein
VLTTISPVKQSSDLRTYADLVVQALPPKGDYESKDPRYRSAVNWTSVTDDAGYVELLMSAWYRYAPDLRIPHYNSDPCHQMGVQILSLHGLGVIP